MEFALLEALFTEVAAVRSELPRANVGTSAMLGKRCWGGRRTLKLNAASLKRVAVDRYAGRCEWIASAGLGGHRQFLNRKLANRF